MQEGRLSALWRGWRAEMTVAILNFPCARLQSEPFDWVQAIIDPDSPETFGDALRSLRFESSP